MYTSFLFGNEDMAGSKQPRSNPPPAIFPGRRRLDSWKEIASYLDRSEKTVRRWEEKEGLPVHRLLHEKRGSVFAYSDELEAWWESRKSHHAVDAESPNQQLLDPATRIAVAEAARQSYPISVDFALDERSETEGMAALEPKANPSPQSLRRRAVPVIISILLFIFGLFAAIYGERFRNSILQRSTPIGIHSLAVLPFENLSGDTDQEYFADGMTAELITELARTSSIRVISRTSVMRYKRLRKPLAEISHELNVDAVVEGEVLRSQNRVRITAQLIDTSEDRHIWAETYDRDLRDVVTLQAAVAQSISQAIGSRVSPAAPDRHAPVRRVDPDAYEAYLKGRFFFEKRTTEGFNKAVDYFQQAVRMDPRFAKAYAALASTYDVLGTYELLPPDESFSKARKAADKALQLDGTLSEAYAARGFASSMYEYDWNAAEQDFQRALTLNTNDATAHHWYAEHLINVGRADRAVTELECARELDPLSLPINGTLGRAYRDAHRYDESVVQCKKTLDLDPDFALGHWCLGATTVVEKRYTEAVTEMQRANALGVAPLFKWGLGYAYAAAGDKARAKAIIKGLRQGTRTAYVPAYYIASIYGALAEKDMAFTWLERAYAERDPQLTYLLLDPFMDPLRADPRFNVLVDKVGLPR
jgi:TolB-like protein/Flp pilus assembly protein TadD